MNYFSHVKHVKVSLTHDCNLKCSYCFDDPNKGAEFEFKYADELFAWLKTLPNLYSVLLFGGEPLMASNVFTIADRVLNELPNAKLGFFTNGTILTPQFEEYLKNERVIVFVTRSSFKETHDAHRKYRNSDVGSFDIVTKNLERIYELCGNRLTLTNTIMASDLGRQGEALIKDFELTDNIKINIHRELDGEMHIDYDELRQMFRTAIDYIIEHPEKCIVNLSTYSPANKQALKRDYLRFVQGTLPFDHLNGVKNILVDIDGSIYPSFPNAEKTNGMGNIFGEVSENYRKYAEEKEGTICQDCPYKYMCSPCYAITDKAGKVINDSYCKYTKACIDSIGYYFEKCKEKGLLE